MHFTHLSSRPKRPISVSNLDVAQLFWTNRNFFLNMMHMHEAWNESVTKKSECLMTLIQSSIVTFSMTSSPLSRNTSFFLSNVRGSPSVMTLIGDSILLDTSFRISRRYPAVGFRMYEPTYPRSRSILESFDNLSYSPGSMRNTGSRTHSEPMPKSSFSILTPSFSLTEMASNLSRLTFTS